MDEILQIEDVEELKKISKSAKRKDILWSIGAMLFFGAFVTAIVHVIKEAPKLTNLNRDLLVCGVVIPLFGFTYGSAYYADENSKKKNRADARILALTKE